MYNSNESTSFFFFDQDCFKYSRKSDIRCNSNTQVLDNRPVNPRKTLCKYFK